MCALLHKFHPDQIPFDTLTAADPKRNYDLGNQYYIIIVYALYFAFIIQRNNLIRPI